MSVAEPTTIDFLGRDAAGRVVLAMTEERTYAEHDPAVLAEDFRAKLNTYVYMIRSGQVAEAAGRLPSAASTSCCTPRTPRRGRSWT